MLRILSILCCLVLVGCAPMEKRSDMPTKKPLATVPSSLTVTKLWSANSGVGAQRTDVKLLAALNKGALYTSDEKGMVSAFDINTGTTIWSKDVNSSISAGPSVSNGILVLGTSSGKVMALDLHGNNLWQAQTSSEVLAAPTIADNMVLVHTMDGGLSAFSLSDGRQLWRYMHNLPLIMLRRSSSPVATSDKIFAGFANGKVVALRKTDGSVEWSYDVAKPRGRTDLQRMADISADPVLKNGVLYVVGYQGNLVAIGQESGQLLWERDLGSYSGIAVADGMVYLSGSTGNVYAIDAVNGETYWLQEDLIGRHLSKPVVFGEYIIVADSDGLVHWLDKYNGARAAYQSIDSSGVEVAPIVNDDNVYVLSRKGKLVALEVH